MKIFILLSLLFTLTVRAQTNQECHDSLKSIMSDTTNSDKMQKILQLQGKLTMHRLAWASTKVNKENAETFKLEGKIEEILNKMEQSSDPEFNKAKESFLKNKLSRNALFNILPFVKDILNSQNEITDQEERRKFIIQSSDIKLLGILAEKEEMKNGYFNHLLLEDKSRKESILNLTKIINSSMRNKKRSAELKNSFLSQIKRTSILLENEILKLPLSEPCKFTLVNQCHTQDHNPLSKSFMSLLTGLNDLDKQRSLRYGDIWLDTRNKKYVAPESLIERYRDLKHKVPTSKSELTISKPEYHAAYLDHLATRVLDRYPYFTKRNELLNDPELLFSLVDALDKKQNYFIYKGDGKNPQKKLLPEGYNRSDLEKEAKEVISKSKDQSFSKFGGIMSLVLDDPKAKLRKKLNDLKKKVPSLKNKELEEEFFKYLVGANLGTKPQKAFEFRGKLYSSKTGKPIEASIEALLNFGDLGETEETPPIQRYNNFSNSRKAVIHQSAIADKKSYIFEGKIFHIGNSEIDIDRLVGTKSGLSPHEFTEALLKADTTPNNQAKEPQVNRLKALQALAEGDQAVIIGPNIVDPKTMKVYNYSQQEAMIKLFQESNDVPRTNYVSIQPDKRKQWFSALMNSAPTFIFSGKEFHTLDANEVKDPLINTPEGMVSYTAKKELIERLNQLNDKDLIIEYHKNFKATEQCNYYSIVDKKSQTLSVFEKSGKLLYSKEVLLGTEKGDKRLVFREYKDKGKQTNGKTSAGVFYSYEFRDQKDGDYYNIFNGCSLAMVTEKGAFNGSLNNQGDYETVLALHQVPRGYEYRNPLYNNGNTADNRESNGCINLTQKDCQEYKEKFSDQGCPIYILPEEMNSQGTRSNRMKVIGDKIAFTPVDRTICSQSGPCDRDYYFSPINQPKRHAIDIKVLNPKHAGNPTVQTFIKTLEDKKEELSERFNIGDSEYNDLAAMAYAVLGIESGFGEEARYKIKEGRHVANWGGWLPKMGQWITQLGVTTKKKLDGNKSKNSRGLTQIKNVLNYTQKDYPEISEDNLTNPKNAAIATMIVLKEMSQQLKNIKGFHNNITPENRNQFLYYLYNGATSQIKNGAGSTEYNVRAREIKRYLSEIHIYEEKP